MISSRLYILILSFLIANSLFSQSVRIDSIRLTGNDQTRAVTILRELLFETGRIYNQDSLIPLLRRSEERLMNLNLFNAVAISQDPDNSQWIAIELKEKWYFWPIPTVEFADRNFNIWADSSFDPRRSNYGLYLFSYNLFGLNHTLKTSLIAGYNTKIALEYRIPFVGGSNTGLRAKVSYVSQDELWAGTKDNRLDFYQSTDPNLVKDLLSEFFVEQRIVPALRLALGGGLQRTWIKQDALDHSDNYLLNNESAQNLLSLGFRLDFDKRNNIFLPSSGMYLETSVLYQRFQNSSAINNLKVSARIQRFLQLSERFSTAISFYGLYNSNVDLPYRFRRILGYENNLRGYESYVIDGHSGFLSNLAFRYHFPSTLIGTPFIPHKSYKTLPLQAFLELFTDAGQANSTHLLRQDGNTFQNQLQYSVGLSLQTLFYNDRLIRFEYSVNAKAESGFYIHFKKAI